MKKVLVFISLLLSIMFLSSCMNKPEPKDNIPDAKEKTFAADTLFSEDGSFGNDSEGILTVAFIGGSLTDAQSYTTEEGFAYGGKMWTNLLCKYLEEKFPNRKIKPINSGIGGTGTDYGSLRFEETILRFAPDIIFYDTINDTGKAKDECQVYMEAMTRMTQQLDKIPAFIYLYTPYAVEKDSEQYQTWERGKNWKQEIADYYGVGSIDIYDYMQKQYAKTDYPTFLDFIVAGNQYGGSIETGFDVHGGYGYYADAIIDVFNNNPSSIIKRPIIREEWFDNGLYQDTAYMHYNIIRPTSTRLTYTGDWMLYDIQNSTIAPAYFNIGHGHGEYAGMSPHKDKYGIITTTDKTATVEFTTDANAVIIDCKSTAEINRMDTDVYIDGELTKTFETYSIYIGMRYIKTIAEFSDGLTHTIKLVMRPLSEEIPVFEFAYIGEAYTESALNK